MYCPNPTCQQSADRPRLMIAERSGIEIDYCPECRGVWLDRGELDKLIERAQADNTEPHTQPASPQPQHYQQPQHQGHYQQDHHYRDSHYKNQGYGHHGSGHHGVGHHGKYKRKSLLSEIFDF